jgi:hypothetical protein
VHGPQTLPAQTGAVIEHWSLIRHCTQVFVVVLQ